MLFRTKRDPIIRASTVSSDSPRCVDVEASNRKVKMYVKPQEIVNYGKKI